MEVILLPLMSATLLLVSEVLVKEAEGPHFMFTAWYSFSTQVAWMILNP
jgi:hypothetical protein